MVQLNAPIPTSVDELPLKGSTLIVLDLETTGVFPKGDYKNPKELPDDITEVSAMKFKDGVLLDQFYSLVKPGKPIPAVVEQKTGITNAMVQKDGKDPKQVLPALANFVGQDAIFVGHNAMMFDNRFIRAQAARLGLAHIKPQFDYN